MCRKHFVLALSVLLFGAGILVGGWIESGLIRFLVACGLIGVGVLLLNQKCWHK